MIVRTLGAKYSLVLALLSMCAAVIGAQQPAAPAAGGAPAPGRGRGAWPPDPMPTYSRIKVYDVDKKTVTQVFASEGLYESPTFTADGTSVQFDSGERKLYQVPVGGGEKVLVGPPDITWSHDRGLSGDGKVVAVGTLLMKGDWTERRTLPAPFYVHSMSRDGLWVGGACSGQMCRISTANLEVQKFTSLPPSKDNADFSHDGKWLYYDTRRDGHSEIWRVPTDAGLADDRTERVTDDAGEDWWAHPSPDGKWVVLLSYAPGVQGRASMVDVTLRLVPAPGAKATPAVSKEIVKLSGGLASFARNSWSPDSKKIAFASYERP